MAKLTHSKLWTLTHFIGSAAIFVIVAGMFWSLHWTSVGGAYEGTANNLLNFQCSVPASYTYLYANFANLLPITALVNLIFEGISSDGAFILSFSFALDAVIWFNVLVWAVQMIVFVPDWCFHYLERCVMDGERRF